MTDRPITLQWDGEAMVPATQYWARLCDKHFVVGETYMLATHHDRSDVSHRHYFASIREAWKNLPENLADQYPTPEALRKKALISKGWRDERSIVCASKAEALRVSAFIKPIDETAIVVVRDNVVLHWTAKSQSYRAMGKNDFRESKDAVLDYCADLIGVDSATLNANAEQAA